MIDKEKHKKILNDTMKAFIAICDYYNLKYVASFGTVLGAVRHKGFIPWDDDIDVYMLREDYEKFIRLDLSNTFNKYEVISCRSDSNFYLSYAKLCNKNTTIWEYEEFEFPIGVFVDVFPLDFYNINSSNLLEKYQKAWVSNLRALFTPTISSVVHQNFNIRYLCSSLLKMILYKTRKKILYDRFLSIEQLVMEEKGEHLVLYGESAIFVEDFVLDIVEVPFEDYTIKIPRRYEEYLEIMYSDWRQLPPIEQRKNGHAKFYFNLEKRESIHEIKFKF